MPLLGRFIKSCSTSSKKKVMPHDELMARIRKSLYFGNVEGCKVKSGESDDDDSENDNNEREITRPLAEYASELFSEPHKGYSLNRLHSVAAGSVLHATPCSLIMALIYLDRLNITDPGYVRRITPQELFIVSMMISTKFYTGYDDEIYLSDWAEDGNMTEDRLRELEIEFLCAIDWNIYISNEQFFNKLNTVEKELARREGLRRGWLTYAELIQMLPSFTLAKFLFNNITVMAVSYAASVMTIAGAFFLASQIPGNALHQKIIQSPISQTGETSVMNNHRHQNETTLNLTNSHSTSMTIDKNQTNSMCCNVLNVEAELIKLEQQYLKEAELDDLRRRNNEISSDSRLNLSTSKLKQTNEITALTFDTQRNWFTFKDEYSDEVDLEHKENENTFKKQQFPLTSAKCTDEDYCLTALGNYTNFILWNFLKDSATQGSLVRSPTLWFNFI